MVVYDGPASKDDLALMAPDQQSMVELTQFVLKRERAKSSAGEASAAEGSTSAPAALPLDPTRPAPDAEGKGSHHWCGESVAPSCG